MILEIPRIERTSDQTEDVNCNPRSKVRRAGTQNLETHIGANGKSPTRDRNPRNRGFQVGLDFTLLTAEAGPCPEANVLGQTGPHKLGGNLEPGTVDDVE